MFLKSPWGKCIPIGPKSVRDIYNPKTDYPFCRLHAGNRYVEIKSSTKEEKCKEA